MLYKVKFFGSTDKHVQLKQVKMVVQCDKEEDVEDVLRYKMGYEVINGLKITEYNGD